MTITQTRYVVYQQPKFYIDKNIYDILYDKTINYWLASRSVECTTFYPCEFGIRNVSGIVLESFIVCYSTDSVKANEYKNRICPIINIDSNVKFSRIKCTEIWELSM